VPCRELRNRYKLGSLVEAQAAWCGGGVEVLMALSYRPAAILLAAK
jgi:hypothetical protein